MEKMELLKAYAYAELLWNTFKKETDEVKSQMQNRLWYDLLKPYDIEVVYAGMRELAKESDFCNIAKVAKECQTITNLVKDNQLDEDTIFNEINSAISYYGAKEKFDNLSEIAKKVVGSHTQLADWATCDITAFNTVIASNIRKSIRAKIEKENKSESVGINRIELEMQNKKLLENKKI